MDQSARDDVLQEAIEAAANLLEKRGEFSPFAVVMTSTGEIRHLQAMMDEERPESDAVIHSITETIREEGSHDKYRCVGIVSSVNLSDTVEGKSSVAVRVHIDGIEIDAVVCYVPYDIDQDTVTLGDVIATKANDKIFLS
jgi:hypothetical protein